MEADAHFSFNEITEDPHDLGINISIPDNQYSEIHLQLFPNSKPDGECEMHDGSYQGVPTTLRVAFLPRYDSTVLSIKLEGTGDPVELEALTDTQPSNSVEDN